MSESSARFWLVAIVAIALIIVSGIVAGGIKPPPRLDWAFVAIPLVWLAWVGHSLFRISRALVQLGANLLAMYRDVRGWEEGEWWVQPSTADGRSGQ